MFNHHTVYRWLSSNLREVPNKLPSSNDCMFFKFSLHSSRVAVCQINVKQFYDNKKHPLSRWNPCKKLWAAWTERCVSMNPALPGELNFATLSLR